MGDDAGNGGGGPAGGGGGGESAGAGSEVDEGPTRFHPPDFGVLTSVDMTGANPEEPEEPTVAQPDFFGTSAAGCGRAGGEVRLERAGIILTPAALANFRRSRSSRLRSLSMRSAVLLPSFADALRSFMRTIW